MIIHRVLGVVVGVIAMHCGACSAPGSATALATASDAGTSDPSACSMALGTPDEDTACAGQPDMLALSRAQRSFADDYAAARAACRSEPVETASDCYRNALCTSLSLLRQREAQIPSAGSSMVARSPLCE